MKAFKRIEMKKCQDKGIPTTLLGTLRFFILYEKRYALKISTAITAYFLEILVRLPNI